MAETNNSAENDRAGSDAAVMELMVLDRLLYRNRSQHRSGKYFTHLLEVRRACRMLAAPKLPDLLEKGLSLIARVPDSRNGRAREAWVRSAAAGLRHMRVSVAACACSLETIVLASRHLAHQVSQTYFMALSTVFLACLARLFACNLHLGGRLLEVHGALLRTLLAQPCTSECLSASGLAECRIPADTTSFLARLRGSGSNPKTPQRKRAQSRSSGDSGAAAAAAPPNPLPAASGPATNNGSSGASSSGEQGLTGSGGGRDPSLTMSAVAAAPISRTATKVAAALNEDDYDVDDPGVHIGRAAPTESADEDQIIFPSAEASTKNSAVPAAAAAAGRDGDGRPRGAEAAQDPARNADGRGGAGEERARGSGRKSGRAGTGAGNKSETSGWRGGGGEKKKAEGTGTGSGSRTRGVLPPVNHQRKKVMLASEFSDSSSSSSEDESECPGVVGGIRSTNKSGQHETPSPPLKDPPPQGLASTAGVVGVATKAALPLPSGPSLHRPPSVTSANSSSEPQHSGTPLNPHPDPKSTNETADSPATLLAAAEVALSAVPPRSPCHGVARAGDLSGTASAETPQAPTAAAAVVGSGEALGWVIDSRPSPVGDTASSRGRQKGRRREGNKSPAAPGAAAAAAAAANICGGVDSAARSPGQDTGLREKALSTTSAAKVSGKVDNTGDGGNNVDLKSSGGAKPATEPEVMVRRVGADVAETVARPRHDTSLEPARSEGSGSPETAPRSSKDTATGRPAAATIDSECVRGAATAAGGVSDESGGADVAGVEGSSGGADPAAARSRRSELQEAKTKGPPSKQAAETGVAVASDVGPGAIPNLGRQAPQGNGSVKIKAQGSSVPVETCAPPPSETGKKANSGGRSGRGRNDGSGTKRSSSNEARKETPKRLKKANKEKKKKRKGASSGGLGGGKRNAIDDIFGSLL